MAVRAGRALSFPARIARSDAALPLGLLAPSIIYLSLLILVPVAQALLLSIQAENGAFSLEHYDRMVHDQAFVDALANTAKLLVLIVPIQLTLAMAMALLINSRFHRALARMAFRTATMSSRTSQTNRLPRNTSA